MLYRRLSWRAVAFVLAPYACCVCACVVLPVRTLRWRLSCPCAVHFGWPVFAHSAQKKRNFDEIYSAELMGDCMGIPPLSHLPPPVPRLPSHIPSPVPRLPTAPLNLKTCSGTAQLCRPDKQVDRAVSSFPTSREDFSVLNPNARRSKILAGSTSTGPRHRPLEGSCFFAWRSHSFLQSKHASRLC